MSHPADRRAECHAECQEPVKLRKVVHGLSRRNPSNHDHDGHDQADWRQGHNDGKHGIPQLAQVQFNLDNGYPWLPNQMASIVSEAEETVAAVHTTYLAGVATAQQEIARLEASIQEARDRLADAKHELDRASAQRSAPVTPDELLPRSAAEAAQSEADIRGIRYQEREAQFRSLSGYVQTCRHNLQLAEGARSAQEALLNSSRNSAQSEVDGIYAHCSKRLQNYWQGLTEGHRDGDALSVLLTKDELPEVPDVKDW